MPDKQQTIEQRLDRIKERISEPAFLENRGIANEIGSYMFCYDPADEPKVRAHIERLASGSSPRIIVYDLYDIVISILEDSRVLDKMAAFEEKRGADALLDQLHLSAAPVMIVERMKRTPHKRGDVIFITGVGAVHPIVRAHDVMNNMHSSFDDVPVVVFYPGVFDGVSPRLFGTINEGNYYRAFDLLDRRKS